MRRRQIAQAEQESLKQPEPQKKVKKGYCPKCGRHIGRGIAFHIKRCEGT